MDVLKELKARDKRIENLETALLLLMSRQSGPVYNRSTRKSAQEILESISSQPDLKEKVQTLLNELGSKEKIFEVFALICKKSIEPEDKCILQTNSISAITLRACDVMDDEHIELIYTTFSQYR